MLSRRMAAKYQVFPRTGPQMVLHVYSIRGRPMRLNLRSHAPNQRKTHMYRFNHPSAPNTSPEQKPEQSRSISLKKALAIGAVPLLLLFGAAFQSSNSVPGQLQAIQSQISALQAKVVP